jgi:hypothetical protein
LRNQIIGTFDFDVKRIYLETDHMLEHKWIALNNPESSNFSEVSALLKVSVSVTHEDDE